MSHLQTKKLHKDICMYQIGELLTPREATIGHSPLIFSIDSKFVLLLCTILQIFSESCKGCLTDYTY